VGCSSRAGRCHRPAEPSCLRSAARVGWRRRAPCRPRTSYVLALGAKQPAPNTQCRVNCARRLIWPIRALRQQAATCGSEWPRESGAHPWRVPTHSGFTRPRSGMKGPDWGLAGAGTTVKRPPCSDAEILPVSFPHRVQNLRSMVTERRSSDERAQSWQWHGRCPRRSCTKLQVRSGETGDARKSHRSDGRSRCRSCSAG